MKNNKPIVYKNAEDFAKGMGLSNVEIALIREKRKLIEKLRAERIKAKLSQADVAKKIGTRQPAIARMESGPISQVSMDFLIKIAIVLGVPVSVKPKQIAA